MYTQIQINKSSPLNTSFSKFHEAISSYFPIKLTKIQDILIDNKQYTQYIGKLYCNLCTEIRYLVAIVPRDIMEIGTQVHLSKLNWICFQTRTTNDRDDEFSSLELTPQHISDSKNLPFLKTEINITNKTQDRSIYTINSNAFSFYRIELLHTFPKKDVSDYEHSNSKSISEYTSKGSILSAINTFQCVITSN